MDTQPYDKKHGKCRALGASDRGPPVVIVSRQWWPPERWSLNSGGPKRGGPPREVVPQERRAPTEVHEQKWSPTPVNPLVWKIQERASSDLRPGAEAGQVTCDGPVTCDGQVTRDGGAEEPEGTGS